MCLLAAHGWNIDIGIQAKGSGSVRHLRVVGTTGVCGLGACTLLGPEGPDDPASFGGWGDGFFRPSPRSALGWWVWGFWPSVENYIVDASILD
jgi:hypothetical protein